MRVVISSEGEHDPPGQTIIIDGRLAVMDLAHIPGGTLVDPTILRAEWGPTVTNGEAREGGLIFRRDGSKPQAFWDRNLLTPYIAAFEKRQKQLATAHGA